MRYANSLMERQLVMDNKAVQTQGTELGSVWTDHQRDCCGDQKTRASKHRIYCGGAHQLLRAKVRTDQTAQAVSHRAHSVCLTISGRDLFNYESREMRAAENWRSQYRLSIWPAKYMTSQKS
ncbi:hypothetical protein Q8A67_011403 [Cirrhinus molitorella]|uniref:Uncharacterized protein n=1 Tax=Cirrhinus molitorella TaxID=172907 RepID=A0AA88TM47_9TELE|nr:hypothetical protein Q8A67_011403 [Cirrhinus molitorella]